MIAPSASTRVFELRKSKRYRLSAPVFFFWAPQTGPPQSGEGMTRDVNTTGVYVKTEETPPVGALVQMDIMLPNMAPSGPGLHLTAEGVVLRVDQRGAKCGGTNGGGFAASVQFYPEPSESALSHIRNSG